MSRNLNEIVCHEFNFYADFIRVSHEQGEVIRLSTASCNRSFFQKYTFFISSKEFHLRGGLTKYR